MMFTIAGVSSVVLVVVGVAVAVVMSTGSTRAPEGEPSFVKLAAGQSCAERGLEAISSAALCAAAARDLGLAEVDVLPVSADEASAASLPDDCYYQSSRGHADALRLNGHRARRLASSGGLRSSHTAAGGVALETLCVGHGAGSGAHRARRPPSEVTLGDSFQDMLWGSTSTLTTTLTGTTTTETFTGTSTVTTTETATVTETSTITSTDTSTSTTTFHLLPTLFCYTVMQVDGYEFNNVRTMLGMKTSIFECDDYTLFSDKETTITPGVPVPGRPELRDVPGRPVKTWVLMDDLSTHPKEGSLEGILNTRIFMNAWKYLDLDGRFRKYDWTVKVDPDAVFFPSRLRENLAETAPAETHPNLYIVNCKISFGLFGAIEVFSARALDTYLKGQDKCKKGLNWKMMGEDLWMAKCLEFLGVEHKDDFGLLSDGYCNEPPTPCVSGKVAFHAFKTSMQFMQCVNQARKAQPEDPRAIKVHRAVYPSKPTPQKPFSLTTATTTPKPVQMRPDMSEEEYMEEVVRSWHGPVDAELPSAAAYRQAVQSFVASGADGLVAAEASARAATTVRPPTARPPSTPKPTAEPELDVPDDALALR